MASIGIRDLKNHATEIVRSVREEQMEYIVTYRGEPVAMLLPLAQNWQQTLKQPTSRQMPISTNLIEELAALSEEIAHSWRTERTAAEAVAEQRR